MSQVAIVVPCFNEERRLELTEVERLLAAPEVVVLLVDDGSRDGTRALLAGIASRHSNRIRTLLLDRNGGKAEAVRQGLLRSLDDGAAAVGYVDADFSTPAPEVLRLCAELERPDVNVVMGARVARAGATIERHPLRHFTGRVFATTASFILGEGFYDTQCGAKFFRDTPALREALTDPFLSRWAFDVELLGRLLNAREPIAFESFAEVPLRSWADVGGSKLGLKAMTRAGFDLARIHRDLTARKHRGQGR